MTMARFPLSPPCISSIRKFSSESWLPTISPLSTRFRQLPRLYGALSKLKLSSLVVVTTMAGFQLSPEAFNLPLLGWVASGVALSSFSANSFNQWLEIPFDSQMGRTRGRPLPTHQLNSSTAFTFGILSGVTGVGLLAMNVSWMAAILSGINIALYAGVYTPMKRYTIANTWIGAIVGAIPPMIGYVGGGGGGFSLGCLTLGAILYCWQFPHFNALSWNLRADYSRAGYCMASVLNPNLTVDSALRHSIALLPLSAIMIYTGVCNQWFMVDSSVLNILLIYLAYQFRKNPTRESAKRLFLFTLAHLPLLLILMVVHRNVKKETVQMPQ